MDALLLARMQFAANISFHILFPTITIALGWALLFFRLRWLRTQDPTTSACEALLKRAHRWRDALELAGRAVLIHHTQASKCLAAACWARVAAGVLIRLSFLG